MVMSFEDELCSAQWWILLGGAQLPVNIHTEINGVYLQAKYEQIEKLCESRGVQINILAGG